MSTPSATARINKSDPLLAALLELFFFFCCELLVVLAALTLRAPAPSPQNPPTLGARRVGSFTGAGIGCTVEKKLYGGRGLGLVRGPQMGVEVLQIGGFIVGK